MVAPSDVEQAWEAIEAQIARRDPWTWRLTRSQLR